MPSRADPPLAGFLDTRERDRLAAILSRLSSPYDNERAAAGLLASVFVARHGLEWLDLTSLLLPIRRTTIMQAAPGQQQDRRSSGSREWSGYCRRRRSQPGETLNLFV
jgi:hypothetical protein